MDVGELSPVKSACLDKPRLKPCEAGSGQGFCNLMQHELESSRLAKRGECCGVRACRETRGKPPSLGCALEPEFRNDSPYRRARVEVRRSEKATLGAGRARGRAKTGWHKRGFVSLDAGDADEARLTGVARSDNEWTGGVGGGASSAHGGELQCTSSFNAPA
eukprot:CAMPEP_0174730428 /NCGR_PEP_ID=MMETSP1094-20130205/55597_1 /TAXON_ID=156173 /ORGANISM="Chrysochromulina brevifilum, Strain UTEX LB 985" /LENGTH=161 /DNA_ID=CAMNT_0015932691 /DNA_START=753 /DNA_END=1236 /DNA_ORIENTATION=+